MKHSDIALKILAATECGLIKSNTQFWKNYSDINEFEKLIQNNHTYIKTYLDIIDMTKLRDNDISVICKFDEEFPFINQNVRNNSEKPYLLFYKGNLSLLSELNNNVSVIGTTDPEQSVISREEKIITKIVEKNLVIVSGLAKGCDTVAHKKCLELEGKTIAILPSTISNIYPPEHKGIAEEIVKKNGLLLSEYYKDSSSRFEQISRLVKRDRLQAMFAKAIILIASYRKDEGDSGSRHAMDAAKKYGIKRFVMYDKESDKKDNQFGLNSDLIEENDVEILKRTSIDFIHTFKNPYLSDRLKIDDSEQITLQI